MASISLFGRPRACSRSAQPSLSSAQRDVAALLEAEAVMPSSVPSSGWVYMYRRLGDQTERRLIDADGLTLECDRFERRCR